MLNKSFHDDKTLISDTCLRSIYIFRVCVLKQEFIQANLCNYEVFEGALWSSAYDIWLVITSPSHVFESKMGPNFTCEKFCPANLRKDEARLGFPSNFKAWTVNMTLVVCMMLKLKARYAYNYSCWNMLIWIEECTENNETSEWLLIFQNDFGTLVSRYLLCIFL